MKTNVPLWWESTLSVFKYLVAAFMMFAGTATAFSPLRPQDGELGFVFGSRLALVAFGVVFFGSGAALMYGKVRKSKRWTGHGLMAIFCCFVFAGILNSIADSQPNYENLGIAVIMGALYLRWRFKTAYVNPKHFKE